MTRPQLSRLEPVDVRSYWESEPKDFTPWLAQADNLELLGDTIGLELELEEQEKSVGPYRADILCKDTATDTWVLIENQLEKTDHTHLGQLMTYAAGLNAVTIVWIASRFTDEHRAALDWLNEITDINVNFFGLEIELWRIGTSHVAPKFNLSSKPNDWTKTVASMRQSASGEISDIKQLQQEYWASLSEYLSENGSFIKAQKPLPQHWTNFAIGRSNFHIASGVNTQSKTVTVSLILTGDDAKPHYHLLLEDKDDIENEFGAELNWREMPNKKSSEIGLYNKNFNPLNKDSWETQHAWIREVLEAFHNVFSRRVKALNAEDFIPDTNGDEIDSDE